jgi:hypothetical protein
VDSRAGQSEPDVSDHVLSVANRHLLLMPFFTQMMPANRDHAIDVHDRTHFL